MLCVVAGGLGGEPVAAHAREAVPDPPNSSGRVGKIEYSITDMDRGGLPGSTHPKTLSTSKHEDGGSPSRHMPERLCPIRPALRAELRKSNTSSRSWTVAGNHPACRHRKPKHYKTYSRGEAVAAHARHGVLDRPNSWGRVENIEHVMKGMYRDGFPAGYLTPEHFDPFKRLKKTAK